MKKTGPARWVPSMKQNSNALRHLGLWLLMGGVFLGVFYWGNVTSQDDEIVFREFAPRFWKEAWRSLILIFPALLTTLLLSSLLGVIEWAGRASLVAKELAQRQGRLWHHWLYALPGSLAYLASLMASLLAALPPFLLGIFFIRTAHLDTVHCQNLSYGILCLSLFNLDYFYRRSRQKIEEAYGAPHVLFARSLGLSEREIWRHHILPRIVRDNLALVRELLPHLTVESIVIEITFSYNGLLHSAIQAMRYGNPAGWYYLAFAVLFFVLFLSLAGYLCRVAEDHVCPAETIGK
jgi:ABC-type dipeptide/oligopeptide/nickel transport system permease component